MATTLRNLTDSSRILNPRWSHCSKGGGPGDGGPHPTHPVGPSRGSARPSLSSSTITSTKKKDKSHPFEHQLTKKKDLLGINEFLLMKCVMISWIYCVLLSSIPSTLQSSRRWAESVFCCCLLEWNDNRPASLIAPLSRPSPFADLHETHAANKSLDDNIRRANLEFFCCWSKMSMSSPRFTGLIIIISYSSFLKKLIVYNSRFLIFVTEAGKNGFTHSSIEF